MSPTSRVPSPSRRRIADFFGLTEDWERPRPRLGGADAALVVAVAVFGLLTLELTRSFGVLDQTDAPVWAEWLAVISGAALLLGRRRWPLSVALLAAAHMFASGVIMPAVMSQVTLQLVYFVALLSGVAWARDRRLMLVTVTGIVLFMFAWLSWQFSVGSGAQEFIDDSGDGIGRPGAFPPLPAAVGFTMLVNALYFGGAIVGGAFAWRAARQRDRLVEQSATILSQAERLQERAVVEERLRIARELHDVVAHHVSAMGIQAGAARRVLDRDSEAAAEALSTVEDSSREALTQMRNLVGTLRTREGDEESAADGSGTSRTTGATVVDLPALVAQWSTPGRGASYTLSESPDGSASQLPPGVARSVYRTAQEALTNVRRHSTADRVLVTVRVDCCAPEPYAEVEVVDNGRPRAGTSGSGLGQLGIRERASMHSGVAEIGPRVTGGYRVRVRFPLQGAG